MKYLFIIFICFIGMFFWFLGLSLGMLFWSLFFSFMITFYEIFPQFLSVACFKWNMFSFVKKRRQSRTEFLDSMFSRAAFPIVLSKCSKTYPILAEVCWFWCSFCFLPFFFGAIVPSITNFNSAHRSFSSLGELSWMVEGKSLTSLATWVLTMHPTQLSSLPDLTVPFGLAC